MHGLIPAMALLAAVPAVTAQEPPIAAAVCGSCHGAGGVSQNPIVPTLAGQPYTLIEDNLLAFRAGKRSCGQERADGSPAAALAMAMCAIVRDLPDREIADLAAWYQGRDFVAATQEYDAAVAARGAELHRQGGCDRCHANGGRETLGIAPVLAGQWTAFLRRALHDIRAGKRQGPKEMIGPIRGLADADIEALLNYYARPQDRAQR